jgi:hypothetical protein
MSLDVIAPIALFVGAGIGMLVLVYAMLEPAARAVQSSARQETNVAPIPHAEPGLPVWSLIAGGLLGLATLVLLGQAYFGFQLHVPGSSAPNQAVTAGLPSRASGLLNAWYMQSTDPLTTGTAVDTGPSNKQDALQPGDLVLRTSSHDLVQVQADGQIAPAPARDGDRVWLPNAGPWDQSSKRYTGIAAVFADGKWDVDLSSITPTNPNSDFGSGDDQNPIPNYAVTPDDAKYTITRMTDQDGPFVRVQITQDTAFLQINGHDPVSRLDGVPLTVRAQVRAKTSGQLNLSVWDIVGDSGRVKSYTNREPGSQDWTTLSQRVPVLVYPSPDDYFAIGLVQPQAGDWFDVRNLSVYVGTI